MGYNFKLVSSLEKIFFKDKIYSEHTCGSMLKNEIYSFQLAGTFHDNEHLEAFCQLEIESALKDCIRVYRIGYVPSLFPCLIEKFSDDDFITKTPGLFPDPLYEIKDGKLRLIPEQQRCFWFTVEPDGNFPGGIYPIKLNIYDDKHHLIEALVFTLEIIDLELPKQELLCTGWFHGDCLSTLHHTEILSDSYFELTEKYLKVYRKFGHNMILTPIFTPPLDTDIGGERPTNQLVDVKMSNGEYSFQFSNLKKWISLCLKCGIEYFEISHLFTQWGAFHAPKIMAEVDGMYKRIFGWETDSLSEEYREFLNAFMPQLKAFLCEEGIYDKCLFHVSDEPAPEHEMQYKCAREILCKHIEEDRLFDALSEYSFYEKNIIKKPVVPVDHIKTFIENDVQHLWAYYCCCQGKAVANRFMAMPSYRNRILGYQLYKYRIEGFLQWGFNFWFSGKSKYVINPYMDTSAGECFPSGDAFVVYPLNEYNEVVCSLRLYVFNEGLQDLRALKLLESLTNRNAVEAMLDDICGFEEYPRESDYIIHLRESINQKLKSCI